MRHVPAAAQRKRVAILLSIAQLGYAHWFFGNLYEAVVRLPNLLAEERRLASVLSPGSPVRYYLPGIPVVIGATLSALVAGWPSRNDRAWLGAVAASALAGVLMTVYLVRAVNLKLFVAGESLPPAERERLLRIWYRVNAVRLVSAGTAWLLAAWWRARAA
jgi:hypothetical protein